MNIELEGHHVDITESMRSLAAKKFKKIVKRYERIDTINIKVKVERSSQHIDVKVRYLGDAISVSAVDKDFYTAIDLAATKLTRSLESRKGQIDTKGREKPSLVDSDSDAEPELKEY